ncbi:uncharacterized protein LOC112052063 isoform X2 [Bicyclus anynana]|nr:uncharacterized protein LOC112052063 isoform X2 [Bicyclus anynana]XP_023946740.2 uncharacterized protein LOC112052063 isoform X2 [Bicyclus anynana]XP_023946741.2 uncharacterized protein LOC112052063 isoform X2 [Bicyclus anynana]XP_052740181.1 uncharacterized protein LOC112052063 isoform X2 [Bicyclus anynana]
MASDILTSLELDKEFQSGKIIVVKEINGCDSAFITSCVLGHCIKNKNAVFVISIHNSFLHYHNVGLKMNYNLQKSIDMGLVNFYELGKELVDCILDFNNPTQDLLCKITEKINGMSEKHGSVNIIFDGISHLLDLQFDLREVNQICKEIIDCVRSFNNSFALFHCIALEDNVTNVLANLLAHKADIVAEVESLSSGLSADVSGHLTFKYLYKKYQKEHLQTLDVKTFQYLYKLFDRGVKLLAPGTV